MPSMNTTMEDVDSSSVNTIMEDGDSFLSSTNAIYRTSCHSGWGCDSMISDPNIASSSTSVDDHHQQISAAGGGGDNDLTTVSSAAASCSWFKNNRQNDHQQEIRIFNVDFRAISEVAESLSLYKLPQVNFPHLETVEGTSFRRFKTTLVPSVPIAATHSGQGMLKRSITFFRNLYMTRLRPTSTHHMISDREAVEENFIEMDDLENGESFLVSKDSETEGN